jgi:hypothetical protein
MLKSIMRIPHKEFSKFAKMESQLLAQNNKLKAEKDL